MSESDDKSETGSRRPLVVIKVGSGVLTREDGLAIDDHQLEHLVAALAALMKNGNRCILVSSGAVAAGLMTFGRQTRPDDMAELQACAAVGQARLMHFYETLFLQHDLHIAQLLLTYGDFETSVRETNVRNTLSHLLAIDDVIPIINENDSVAIEELKFGDNDTLSVKVAILAGAQKLILLTGVDGLIDSKTGKHIDSVRDIDEALNHVNSETGKFSVGGMRSKLEAVRLAMQAGIPAVIAHGRNPQQLGELAAGGGIGTWFVPAK